MSNANRKLSSLLESVFQPVKIVFDGANAVDPGILQKEVVKKLRNRKRMRTGGSTNEAIETVSDLIQTPTSTLLHCLDPWLSYGKFRERETKEQ